MKRKRLLPSDVQTILARRFSNEHRDWLECQGQWPLSLSIGALTERDVVDDAAAVRAWVEAWVEWRSNADVSWEVRNWPRLGEHRLPTSITFSSPDYVAAVVGQGQRWQRARERYVRLISRWETLKQARILGRNFDALADYDDEEFERLFRLLAWLDANPESGMYVRQLPIEGLHSKWLEQRKGLVTELLRVLRDSPAQDDFFALCGLQRFPHRLRLRLLSEELRRGVGGIGDIEAPAEELAVLPIAPSTVLIIENLESALALPDIPGTVAVMKLGHAVGVVNQLRWIDGPRCIYWGDIDTHGFAMLDRARQSLPSLRSVLMDKETLLAHRTLWVDEPSQHGADDLPRLHDFEREVYRGLRENEWGKSVRLEQERIPWTTALPRLRAALA